MAARFGPLGDDDVSTFCEDYAGLGECLHLTNCQHVRAFDLWQKGTRVAERQHDRRWLMTECHIERFWLLRKRPRDEATADSPIASGGEFPLKPVGVRIPAADNSEPTGSTDGCCKRTTRDEAHGGKHDRMLDTKPLRQAGRNRHCLRSV